MGKDKFLKNKESIRKTPIEAGNICNILPRLSVSNGLIVHKLNRDLKCRSHVYFEPVHLHIIYQPLAHSKSHNKFQHDLTPRIYALHKITIALKFMSYINQK